MLSIANAALSNGIPGLSTDFALAQVALIDDKSLIVWFTRPVLNATRPSNYNIAGAASVSVILAQYENDARGVRLYLDSSLSVGQWTISFASGGPLTLISDDSDHFTLPSNTQVVLDLIDKSSQDSLGTGLAEGPVSQFIPKAFRNNKVYAGIIAGIEAGDAIVSNQARLAANQMSLSTASGKFLTTRAVDRGTTKPEKLGISDATFRKLAVETSNNKLTTDALLSVLETMYGPESVKAYTETAISEPFEILNKAYLDFIIDGKTHFRFVANWTDYRSPLRATAIELTAALNYFFDKNSINAYATNEKGKVRIYSKTKGIKSSLCIAGGTLQPFIQPSLPIYGTFSATQQQALQWTLTNPSLGVVRFTPASLTFNFTNPVLKVGDCVTIVGSNFPIQLRGSWSIVSVSFSYYGTTPIESFDIASSYTVP